MSGQLNISLNIKHDFFKNFFFHSTDIESNKIDPNIRDPESIPSCQLPVQSSQ